MEKYIGGLVDSVPPLVGWIVAIILAVIMLRRGGGRAERFLLAGASLMLVQSLIAILTATLSIWLTADRGMAATEAAFVLGMFGLIRGLVGLAGIICLVYAFWIKFKARSTPKPI